jgi:hypothetical protein
MKFVNIKMSDGSTLTASTDYYHNNEGIRVPLTFGDALDLAARYDMRLPTPQEVDAIWRAAQVRLLPRPLSDKNTGNPRFYHGGPGGMTDPKWIKFHHDMIEKQLRDMGHEDHHGLLIAGHKKDIVQHDPNSRKIAIYGWHRSNGVPIQPRSTVHHRDYMDYSQGVRLVKRS